MRLPIFILVFIALSSPAHADSLPVVSLTSSPYRVLAEVSFWQQILASVIGTAVVAGALLLEVYLCEVWAKKRAARRAREAQERYRMTPHAPAGKELGAHERNKPAHSVR